MKAHYKKLIDIRQEHEALTAGDLRMVYSDDDVLVFERTLPNDQVVVVINKGESQRKLNLIDLYNQQTPNRVKLTSLMDGKKLNSHKGSLELMSDAHSVSIYEVKGKLRLETPDEYKQYSKVALRGSEPLDWESDANLLSYDDSEHVWKSEPIELKADETIEFKYVRDGEWLEGDNLTFTPEMDGDYIFIFNPQDQYRITVLPYSESANLEKAS